MSPKAISVPVPRSPSPPKSHRAPNIIDEAGLRDAEDVGHSPTDSILAERIQESDETPKPPGSEAPEEEDSEPITSDSTNDGKFRLPRSRATKIFKGATLRRKGDNYYSASDVTYEEYKKRPVKPRVKRLVAGHLEQIERDTASSIDLYYQSAVPDAVVNAASSTDKSSVGRTYGLRQHVDCPWAVQINSPSVIERLAEVLGVPVITFPDPLM
jgi:hypothetical protein